MSDLVLLEKVKNPTIDMERFLKNMYKWMVQCDLEEYTLPSINGVPPIPFTLDGIIDMLVDIKLEPRKELKIENDHYTRYGWGDTC